MSKVDFYFLLAMIAILGSGSALYLQMREAGYEYEYISSSMAPLVRDRNSSKDINEAIRINQELDQLEAELEKGF